MDEPPVLVSANKATSSCRARFRDGHDEHRDKLPIVIFSSLLESHFYCVIIKGARLLHPMGRCIVLLVDF